MFEQDYIMRLIKDIIRMSLKIFCNIDTKSPYVELSEKRESESTMDKLINLIDEGEINEAENKLFEYAGSGNQDSLKDALLFYYYLNDKDDDFLEKNNFSREEIKQGLEDIMKMHGLSGVTSVLLHDF